MKSLILYEIIKSLIYKLIEKYELINPDKINLATIISWYNLTPEKLFF